MTARNSETTRTHALDRAVAWWSRNSRLFSRGWGDEAVLAEFSDRERYFARPQPIAIEWASPTRHAAQTRRDGVFQSPLEALPAAVATAHVRAWTQAGNESACVILAASRDEGYWIREQVFLPLTARGIDLFLLESPYYGLRRDGRGPSEITVADHGLIALGMVLEARALLEHLQPKYRKLAVAGYSMGGHMAALTAAVSPMPLACAALATGASASAIYTRGLLSWSVDLDTLGGDVARDRLRTLFDVADITNFPPPIRVDAAVVSGCTRDGYVLQSETELLHRHWQGSELRWIDAGHFSALMTQRQALRACVEQAVERL
jgi:Alpha/beta hydrolase domain containing 18